MKPLALASSIALALLVAGCAGDKDIGPAPGDPDAAVGDKGPRRTDTSVGDAPSVQTDRDDRINAPVP